MANADLMRWEKVAIELALEAGTMMTAASGRNRTVDQKASSVDLVTETDRGVEAFLFSEIKKRFPDHKTIGEESAGDANKDVWSDSVTWIIDPIDGTMNFVHTFPFCCVSIGLTVKREAVLGVVYSPFLNKLFTARKGSGAFCNGVPIHTRPCRTLADALLTCELGSDRDEEKKRAVCANLKSVVWNCHGIRALGSAALNICYVASGFADAYFEFGLHSWDMCGAVVILREAGGIATDTRGGPLDLMNRRLIASGSQEIASELSEKLAVHLDLKRDDQPS